MPLNYSSTLKNFDSSFSSLFSNATLSSSICSISSSSTPSFTFPACFSPSMFDSSNPFFLSLIQENKTEYCDTCYTKKEEELNYLNVNTNMEMSKKNIQIDNTAILEKCIYSQKFHLDEDTFHCVYHPNDCIYFSLKNKIFCLSKNYYYSDNTDAENNTNNLKEKFIDDDLKEDDEYDDEDADEEEEDDGFLSDCFYNDWEKDIKIYYEQLNEIKQNVDLEGCNKKNVILLIDKINKKYEDEKNKNNSEREFYDNNTYYNNLNFSYKKNDNISEQQCTNSHNIILHENTLNLKNESNKKENRKSKNKKKISQNYVVKELANMSKQAYMCSYTKIVKLLIGIDNAIYVILHTIQAHYYGVGPNKGCYQVYRLSLDGIVTEFKIKEDEIIDCSKKKSIYDNSFSYCEETYLNVGNNNTCINITNHINNNVNNNVSNIININISNNDHINNENSYSNSNSHENIKLKGRIKALVIDNEGIMYGTFNEGKCLCYVNTLNHTKHYGIVFFNKKFPLSYSGINEIQNHPKGGLIIIDHEQKYIHHAFKIDKNCPQVLNCVELFGPKFLKRNGIVSKNNLFSVDYKGIFYCAIQIYSRILIKQLGFSQLLSSVRLISELPRNGNFMVSCGSFFASRSDYLFANVFYENPSPIADSSENREKDVIQIWRIDISKVMNDLSSSLYQKMQSKIYETCSMKEKMLMLLRPEESKNIDLNIFYDVQFKSCDNEIINAYRGILASKSNYFFSMFTLNMKETLQSSQIISLPDDGATIRKVFQYIYTNEIYFEKKKKIDKQFFAVWKMADRCCLKELINACKRHILRFINPYNAIKILKFSEYFGENYGDIKYTCARYIVYNYKLCLETLKTKNKNINKIITSKLKCKEILLKVLLDKYGYLPCIQDFIKSLIVNYNIVDIRLTLLHSLLLFCMQNS